MVDSIEALGVPCKLEMTKRWLTLALVLLSFTASNAQSAKQPLRRADSFFGLHFDFHASMNDTEIGKTLTESMVDSLLTMVKPDFIQVDSKGHAGVSSYPTKVGYWPGTLVKDPLRLFRDVTRRHGVALYVHHSGVWDDQAVKHHPNWARMTQEGKIDEHKTSLFGPYADSLLIPQLKEISDYGVDGVWIDGDCWGVEPDYSPIALAAFRAETGIQEIPHKKTDLHYDDFLEFNRRAFKRYVTHYTDALHQYNPKFQVASNWAFTSFQPEPVSVPVDFISGDTDPLDGANRSAFQARCIAPQGKPWDLMSWSFGYAFNEQIGSPKPAIQLCQEAAQVMAVGGGFQAYWIQNRDASLTPNAFRTMAKLARFCRARQVFCHKATPVPQVALLYSTTGYKHITTGVYQPWHGELDALRGTMNALLYNQLSTEILMEHHLHGRMRQYPLIVVPSWQKLDESFRQELLQYVREGGNLLVIGSNAVRVFENELGVRMTSQPKAAPYVGFGDVLTGSTAQYQPFEPLAGTVLFGEIYSQRDTRFKIGSAASIVQLGKGQIAGIYLNLGDEFAKRETNVVREFIGTLAQQLFKPQVKVTGSQFVHVALNTKGAKTMINLINMAGSHADRHVHATDEIPPLGPLTVAVRVSQKPKRIMMQPENRPINFTYQNNHISLTIPKLAIHSILVLE